MSLDIKVILVDEKFGKDILKLQGYIIYISAFPVLKIMVIFNYND